MHFATRLTSAPCARVRSDPEVAPGWHRLLYLKAFTLAACSANKGQTCKSEINRATVGENFEFATQVAEAFQAEQVDKYKDALSTKLRTELPRKEDLEREQSRARRKLFVSPDGVYDIDAMISATEASGDLLQVTDRYWGLSRDEAALRFDLIRQKLKPAYITAVINAGGADAIPSGYRTGQLALYAARCSDLLKKTFPEDENVHCCVNAPEGQSCNPEQTYQSRPECNQGSMELSDTNEETLGEEYLIRLNGLSPPPTPPPSPHPPPPPSPPKPPPPPSPPVAITADQGKAMAVIMQRQFCDSVYVISAEARCSRLASGMMTSFLLGDGFSPPPPPPRSDFVFKASPPPPPSPPRPRLPEAELARIVYQSPQAATLSTHFLGGAESDPATASTDKGNAMALENVANATREDVLQEIANTFSPAKWAACSEALVNAALPCRTADLPQRCLNGAEHCGTTWDNQRAPWIELDLREGKPTDRDYYFFALEVSLPTDPELGALFFQSAQVVSEDRGDVTNRFYELEVFDSDHNPLRMQCKPYFKQSVDFYTGGMFYFQYVCLEALAEDDAYVAMRDVRFVRLTLLGEYRMLWLTGTRVAWRTLEALPPSLPPPPPVPPVPPQPHAPPDPPALGPLACHEYASKSFGGVYDVAFKEPCGLTAVQCCQLAYEHDHTAAWQLSVSGCCTLLNVPEGAHVALSVGSTTPIIVDRQVSVSGARQALVG